MEYAQLMLTGSALGNGLQQILMAEDIQPGDEPSYQLCKILYTTHPLGAKMVETPVKLAQSQERLITIENVAEREVRDAFLIERERLRVDYYIRGCTFTARVYGVGSLGLGCAGQETKEPLDLWTLPDRDVYFNILDPLNTAGSIVLNQDPNSPMFQKHGDITASGIAWHRSRTLVMYNEQPVYLSYTTSAFGFSGRSVYQRALFPLKSFVQSMITDDMVTRKAGLLIAMLKNAGSIVNRIMQAAAGIKRALLREGSTNNVLSIDVEEKIETLNMRNTDTAMTVARSNILKNIATAGDMPAQILEQETFAEGFGEGTEDTKNLVRYVNGVRSDMTPLYVFTDKIVQHRAWTVEFYQTIKKKYPDLYKGKSYRQAFYEWQNNFKAVWPSLLEEPESEQSKLEKVKLEGLVAVYEVLGAGADPENKGRFAQWVVDNVNELKKLFRVDLDFDSVAFVEQLQAQVEQQQEMQDAQQEAAAASPSKAPLSLASSR